MSHNKFYILSAIGGLIFIIFFMLYNQIQITKCSVSSQATQQQDITLPYHHKSTNNKVYTYKCNLNSFTSQSAKLGIMVDDRLDALFLNGVAISLRKIKELFNQKELKDWSTGYPVTLSLKKGANSLKIVTYDQGGYYGINIAQSYDFIEFIMLFLFGIIPFLYGLSHILFGTIFEYNYKKLQTKFSWKYLTYVIIAIGIMLRVYYLISIPNDKYQHDYSGHIQSIEYYAQHPFTLPQADKSLEFPQQILYYELSGVVYNLAHLAGLSNENSFFVIRVMSLFFSIIWLLLAFSLAKIYLKNSFSINAFMAFMAFTPSFIILGGSINNDTLNALLGIWALYEVSVYFTTKADRHFWLASLAIALASLTKISSLLFAIYFVMVLLVLYYKYNDFKQVIKNKIVIFGLLIVFIFGFALFKAYIPTTGEFRFVNSALFSNQIIPAFNLNYFFSLHWLELVKDGQSYVFGDTEITHSLPTYLFGTMFTGEWDFSKYFQAGHYFQLASQLLFLIGIIYIVGMLSFFYHFKQLSQLYKLLLIPIIINFLLIVKFLSDYWVICNSDFRYFTPVIGAIGLVFVIGINILSHRFRWIKKIMVYAITLLAINEIYWIISLIAKS